MDEENATESTFLEICQRLRPNQVKAITLLLAGATKTAAAEAADVTPTTISRWLRDPDFVDALATGRAEALADTTARLRGATGTAVTVLVNMATSRQPPAVRVRAAQLLLEYALRYDQREDLAVQMEELARQLEAMAATPAHQYRR